VKVMKWTDKNGKEVVCNVRGMVAVGILCNENRRSISLVKLAIP